MGKPIPLSYEAGDEFDNFVANSGAAYVFSLAVDLIFKNGFE